MENFLRKQQKKARKGLGLVHLTRLELAHPKALPPQGSVYTNFTTGAYIYYSTHFEKCLWRAIFCGFFGGPKFNIRKAISSKDEMVIGGKIAHVFIKIIRQVGTINANSGGIFNPLS